MKIWIIERDSNVVESATFEDFEKDYHKYFENSFCGKFIDNWGDIRIRRYGKKRKCDLYSFYSGSPLISERAMLELKSFSQNKIQFLPVTYNGNQTLYLINVIEVIDCLDRERSIIKRSYEGKIITVKKHEFIKERLENADIFKIPEAINFTIYVSDNVKKFIEESGLIGFEFTEVWNSDKEEVKLREEKLKALVTEINEQAGETVNFEEAYHFIQKGGAVVSGKWKMQKDENDQLVYGEINYDGSYNWKISTYIIPPIFLSMGWKKAEPTLFG
jgi:hypothetical protein